MPVDTAMVAPDMFVIDMFENKPPDPPQTLTALVISPLADKPSRIGELPLPTERPIPYLHVFEIPWTSWPPPSIVRLSIAGLEPENKSTPTKSGLKMVMFRRVGSEFHIEIP